MVCQQALMRAKKLHVRRVTERRAESTKDMPVRVRVCVCPCKYALTTPHRWCGYITRDVKNGRDDDDEKEKINKKPE